MSAFNALKKGDVLKNRYRIEKVLGSGHSSIVYDALDLRSNTHAALKIMDPLLNLDAAVQERFLREVQILQPINHPNIIQVYDAFETQGWRCISMEIANGRDGKAYVNERGPMPFGVFLKIMDQLLGALAACHDKGVVHRDVKPQNIAIDAEHNVKLLDFGIAKMNTMSDLTQNRHIFRHPGIYGARNFPERRLVRSQNRHLRRGSGYARISFRQIPVSGQDPERPVSTASNRRQAAGDRTEAGPSRLDRLHHRQVPGAGPGGPVSVDL